MMRKLMLAAGMVTAMAGMASARDACLPAYEGVARADQLTAAQCRAIESMVLASLIVRDCEDQTVDFNAVNAMMAREMLDRRRLVQNGPLVDMFAAVAIEADMALEVSRTSSQMAEGYRLCDLGKHLFGSAGSREAGLVVPLK